MQLLCVENSHAARWEAETFCKASKNLLQRFGRMFWTFGSALCYYWKPLPSLEWRGYTWHHVCMLYPSQHGLSGRAWFRIRKCPWSLKKGCSSITKGIVLWGSIHTHKRARKWKNTSWTERGSYRGFVALGRRQYKTLKFIHNRNPIEG